MAFDDTLRDGLRTFAFEIRAKHLIFTFTCNVQAYKLTFKTVLVLHVVYVF